MSKNAKLTNISTSRLLTSWKSIPKEIAKKLKVIASWKWALDWDSAVVNCCLSLDLIKSICQFKSWILYIRYMYMFQHSLSYINDICRSIHFAVKNKKNNEKICWHKNKMVHFVILSERPRWIMHTWSHKLNFPDKY